jgi:glycosyltransferase involved in cell wall biosynthesis
MRVLFIADHHRHPMHHRKVDLLADAPDVQILSVNGLGCGRMPGGYPSASGQRSYVLHSLPLWSLGQPDDPRRTIFWPPGFRLGSFRPDIIHCETELAGLAAVQVAAMGRLFARRARLVFHTSENILRERRWYARLLTGFALRAASHLFCDNPAAAQVAQQQGYGGCTTIAAKYGADTRYFRPKSAVALRDKLGINGRAVGYVGRLVPEKGVDTLLRAAVQMQRPPHVVVVGSGPAQAGLEALAGQLGIGRQCRFVGPVSYDMLADYLNLMDALVLPSRTTPDWKEQHGRVLVEAMACKVAVVGSDSGAIPGIIDDAGGIFPEGDHVALASALDKLATNQELRRTLIERGYRRVLEHYTVERVAESVLSVWRIMASSDLC